jgi:hypothetical protein
MLASIAARVNKNVSAHQKLGGQTNRTAEARPTLCSGIAQYTSTDFSYLQKYRTISRHHPSCQQPACHYSRPLLLMPKASSQSYLQKHRDLLLPPCPLTSPTAAYTRVQFTAPGRSKCARHHRPCTAHPPPSPPPHTQSVSPWSHLQ